jgi:hypothetical protein
MTVTAEDHDLAAMTAELLVLEAERRRVEARLARLIGRVDACEAFRADGHATVGSWLAAECDWSSGETRVHVRLAQLGRRCPDVLDALEHGTIGLAPAAELGRLWANPRARRHLPDSIPLLLDQAARLRFDDFRVVSHRWETLADEDGAHRDHGRAHDDRRASAGFVGTRFHLEASGDSLAGAVMSEILERFERAQFDAEWDELKTRLGDAACPALLERNPSQRRFDALHAIFTTAAGAEGAPRSSEPLVNLVIDTDTFQRQLALWSGQQAEPVDPATVTWRRCETSDGVPIDPAAMLGAALCGQVRRIVMDSCGRVLDVGRRRRLFTGAARAAIRLTRSRCCWPGCLVPVGRAQVDHVTPWADGGATDVGNGGLLCGRHNRFKNRGYRTCRDADGDWHTYRPDGTEIAPTRAPP